MDESLVYEMCWQKDVRDLTAAVRDLIWEVKCLSNSLNRK